MCDQDDFDAIDRLASGPVLTRRRFGLMGLGAGLAAVFPRWLGAAPTPPAGQEVEIRTADGLARAYFVHPASGRHPGVLIWPDIFGLRPALKQMAARLAASGYAVLVVDPFYRARRAPDAPPRADQVDPAARRTLIELMGSLSAQTAEVDARAFIDFLDQQAVLDRGRRIGTAGYCMGGALALRTAAARPDRVGAAASFHGASLVTAKPDSPHRLIPRMKGRFLVAIAENDDTKEPTAKDVLREAFTQAGLPAEIEVYRGAQHGWCPTDSPVHMPELAEKAWSRMLALFGTALSA